MFQGMQWSGMARGARSRGEAQLRAGPAVPRWRAVVAISLWLAVFSNVALWQRIAGLPQWTGVQSLALGLGMAGMIAGAMVAILALLAWGRAAKPVLLLSVWVAAFAAYFMLTYGIAIDTVMLINVLQTDVRESADLLHWRMALIVGVLALPPTWWLLRIRLAPAKGLRQVARGAGLALAGVLLALAAGLLAFQPLSSAMRNHKQLRYMMNPLATLYAAGDLAAIKLRHPDTSLHPIAEDAAPGASYARQSAPPLVVLVVGETGRAGNFGVDGYARPTTPMLSARSDLVVARNAWSCGTSTAVSLPCMFSHLGRAEYDDSKRYESLLDVLQRAGLAVLWVDNQAGCKGVCDRVHSAKTSDTAADHPGLCADGECLDMVLLENLDERIAALPREQRERGVVLVLHQMGSHGPAYYKRSPPQDKKFLPECASNALQSCSRQELVNAYDNSIVATDRMLGGLIEWLAKARAQQPTAMMYVADHGESLGENNIYLHGLPYSVAPDVQKHIPWITWLSPAMQQRMGADLACLQGSLAQQRISHDNYFHSVLGLADVRTRLYQPALDIFARCENRDMQKR
ncbi:phosphoethanolamine--lipid A transferase [Comamonas humi]